MSKLKTSIYYDAEPFIEWLNIKAKKEIENFVMKHHLSEIYDCVANKAKLHEVELLQLGVTHISVIQYRKHISSLKSSLIIAFGCDFLFMDSHLKQVTGAVEIGNKRFIKRLEEQFDEHEKSTISMNEIEG
jgi:hypothetical protein